MSGSCIRMHDLCLYYPSFIFLHFRYFCKRYSASALRSLLVTNLVPKNRYHKRSCIIMWFSAFLLPFAIPSKSACNFATKFHRKLFNSRGIGIHKMIFGAYIIMHNCTFCDSSWAQLFSISTYLGPYELIIRFSSPSVWVLGPVLKNFHSWNTK